jgi:hypothetical protein
VLPLAHPATGDAALQHTQKSIFRFWFPLAATWVMMALEGPFLAAVIARLADQEFNLAAWGVAYAFAMLVESPVIMLMSASTALADSAANFRRLRTFTYALSAGVTAVMLLVLTPPVFRFVMLEIISLPERVAHLAYVGLWLLLPWPGAIGIRRFYQGVLIRDGRTRLVALGTVFRLSTMAGTALVLALAVRPAGAYVGAAALAMGVSAEAIASVWMARASVRRVLQTEGPGEDPEGPLSYRRIVAFYYPLALTSIIGLAVQPMLTFFMGRAPATVESLAVFPVVTAATFLFRSLGLSYQEVAIALMGRRFEHVRELSRFALVLGIVASAGLAALALTPLSTLWFQTVSGLSPTLARFAVTPTAVLVPIPLLAVVLSFQRAILVIAQRTRLISWATAIEVTVIALAFPLFGWKIGIVGVTAASVALLAGRIGSTGYLLRPCAAAIRRAARAAA